MDLLPAALDLLPDGVEKREVGGVSFPLSVESSRCSSVPISYRLALLYLTLWIGSWCVHCAHVSELGGPGWRREERRPLLCDGGDGGRRRCRGGEGGDDGFGGGAFAR